MHVSALKRLGSHAEQTRAASNPRSLDVGGRYDMRSQKLDSTYSRDRKRASPTRKRSPKRRAHQVT